MDFVVAAQPAGHQIEKIQGLEGNGVRLVGMVAAQQPVQFVDGLGIVLAVRIAIGGVDFFAGMDVVQI